MYLLGRIVEEITIFFAWQILTNLPTWAADPAAADGSSFIFLAGGGRGGGWFTSATRSPPSFYNREHWVKFSSWRKSHFFQFQQKELNSKEMVKLNQHLEWWNNMCIRLRDLASNNVYLYGIITKASQASKHFDNIRILLLCFQKLVSGELHTL